MHRIDHRYCIVAAHLGISRSRFTWKVLPEGHAFFIAEGSDPGRLMPRSVTGYMRGFVICFWIIGWEWNLVTAQIIGKLSD